MDRGDGAELVQDVVTADITGMEDEIHTGKYLVYGGSQESVSVGDEAEPDHGRAWRWYMIQS
jgi:hypothetical protein